MTDDAGESGTKKHLAAFLGAPVGSAILAAFVWLVFSEPCSAIGGINIDCVPIGGMEFGLGEVTVGATVVAAIAALAIELQG